MLLYTTTFYKNINHITELNYETKKQNIEKNKTQAAFTDITHKCLLFIIKEKSIMQTCFPTSEISPDIIDWVIDKKKFIRE